MDNITGALRGELQLKTFILFILRHFDTPLPSETLTSLSFDRVADLLEFSAALSDLEATQLVTRTPSDGYSITPFGLQTLSAVENELPAATRKHTLRDIEDAKIDLQRRAAADATIERGSDGLRVTLSLRSDGKDVLKIETLLPSEASAERAARVWESEAHSIYKELLARLENR